MMLCEWRDGVSLRLLPQASAGGVRRFTKPPESLERSLELSRHHGRKRTQKRPNYKNLGEEEEDDDERTGGGGVEEGWDDDARGGEGEGGREREKGKGTEGGGGSSKGSRASGETAEGECECVCVCVSLDTAVHSCVAQLFISLP